MVRFDQQFNAELLSQPPQHVSVVLPILLARYASFEDLLVDDAEHPTSATGENTQEKSEG